MAGGHDRDKLVRDSYTIPRDEYRAIDGLKARSEALAAMRPKKSELLRAGLRLLAKLPDAAFKRALLDVPRLETGRPKGTKAVEAETVVAKPTKAAQARVANLAARNPAKAGKAAKPKQPAVKAIATRA